MFKKLYALLYIIVLLSFVEIFIFKFRNFLILIMGQILTLLAISFFLTFFILMDYSIHSDTISMELSIWYFNGLSIKVL